MNVYVSYCSYLLHKAGANLQQFRYMIDLVEATGSYGMAM